MPLKQLSKDLRDERNRLYLICPNKIPFDYLITIIHRTDFITTHVYTSLDGKT